MPSTRADFAAAFCNKAKSLFLSGRHEEAVAAYDRALTLRPELLEAWLGRANLLYRLGRYDEAAIACERALALKPDHAEAWVARGNSCLALQRLDEALTAYDQALALEPDLAEACFGRGNIFHHRNRHADAVAAYDTALALKPELAEAWVARGNACYQLKRLDEALTAYDQALALKPDLAEACSGRGKIFHQRNRHADALAAYDMALAIKPGLADVWLGRGRILQLLKRPEEAMAAYRQALARGGDAEVIRYTLASLGADAVPAAAPKRLIAELFDHYADQYDQHMVGTLKYQMPELLLDALLRFLPQRKLVVLDLGCGTGLFGERLRPLAEALTGIDISPNMLQIARQRGVYDDLVCADLTEFLNQQSASFDLVVATDVFLYIGDLAGVFRRVRDALRPGGFFGFSVEASEEGDFILRATQRFAHSTGYLRKLAGEHGFVLETIEPGVIRQEDGIDVAGTLAVLRCP
jgi:predicted TPR repeat methyltransferase